MVQSYPSSQTRADDKRHGWASTGNDTTEVVADKIRDGMKTAEDAANRIFEQGRQVTEA